MLFTSLGRSVLGKNCALCHEYRPRPAALDAIQDLWHSFSQYGPPGWCMNILYRLTEILETSRAGSNVVLLVKWPIKVIIAVFWDVTTPN